MAALVDTNILVYRFDVRFPNKQRIALELLRRGIVEDSIRVPHQAILEFVAAVTRPLVDNRSLLTPEDARREAEESWHSSAFFIPTKPSSGWLCAALLPTSSRGLMRISGRMPSTTGSRS